MPNVEIEQTIFKETQGLSANALQEVLDFIQFIRVFRRICGLLPATIRRLKRKRALISVKNPL